MSAKKPAMSPSAMPVNDVLDKVTGPRREEADQLLALLAEVSGEQPVVWAGRIIGFGQYHYKYASGHEGDAPLISFNSNSRQHTIYLIGDFEARHAAQAAELGNYEAGKGCLYLKRLVDIDLAVLRTLLERSVRVRRGVDRESR